MTLTTGMRVGRYEIAGVLGAGGMGEVYRARDTELHRDVAIKVLHASAARDPDRLRRFQQEARATGFLNHPNILTIFDVGRIESGEHAGAPFIVTELLAGRTLREELESGALAPRKAVEYGVQIARALSAAHAKGIVHRDLKPENLFVAADGRVKVLDFGIAKLIGAGDEAGGARAGPTETAVGLLMGTVDYMSPEQARGEPVDRRSDLFTFGVILYEMLSGERPFRGRTISERMSALLRDSPPPLSAAVTAEAPGLERIIRHCLEKAPEQRFQSANDLAFDLESLAGKSSVRSTGTVPAAPVARRRHRFAMLVMAVTAIALAGAWLFLGRGPQPQRERQANGVHRATPFLATDAIEDHPAWSPTGNLIAYVSNVAGNDDIWVSDPSGTNPINLTADFEGADSVPAWSLDGQRVAFFSGRDGGGIYTMNALGGDVRKTTSVKPGVLYMFSLTWSRDGSLLYTNFDEQGEKQVYRVAAGGSVPSCLTCQTPAARGRSGELSPSGELLVYKTTEMGPRGTVLLLHLASGRVTSVLDQADMPRWTHDGKRIVFISSRDGTPDLWQIDVDPVSGEPAGGPQRLTSGLAVTSFGVAPGGRQILAVTQRSHASPWSFPAAMDRILETTAGTRWTSGQFMDTRPRWLPDDGGVLFQSNRRGSLDVWMLASPGASPARLTTGAGAEQRPRISPDGRWIAFDVVGSGGEYVHVMRRDGSGVRIPDERWRQRYSMTCCAAWSPDGTRLAIAISHVKGSTSAIVRMDPGSGAALETTELDLPGAADEYHRWSPDGRHIVYEAVTEGSWDLWVVNADGSEPRRLTTLPGSERFASWHPRLPFIYFEKDEGEIWRVPIDAAARPAGAPQPWLTLRDRIEAGGDAIDFDRAGNRVLVALRERASDIWLVELDPASR